MTEPLSNADALAPPQTEDQQWERSVQQLTESLLTMPAAQRARVLAGLPEFTTDSERALLDRCAELQAERDEARDWVRKLTSTECTLTCVYCGHAYPPGTPAHGAEVLTAHIAQCEKHPMRAVIVAKERAEARVLQLEEALEQAHAELRECR